MGQIERTLAKLRQRHQAQKSQNDEARQRKPKTSRPAAAPPEQAEVEPVVRSDVLLHARPITLDPRLLEENRITGLQSSDVGGPAYKMLRTRVLQRMRSNGWKKLAITSPRTQAGKTLTAINTAISLAQEPNQQVVLVDLDLRNPSIQSSLGLNADVGLSDHLLRGVPIEKVIVKLSIPRLYIVPNWERLENSSEVIASAQMAQLTQTLAATSASTIVIFDLPPLLDADDMLTFMPQVDAVLFVVAQGETQRGDLERSNELLKDLTVLGTVLNKSNDEAPSYY
jgi:protein-tyrosine kinase